MARLKLGKGLEFRAELPKLDPMVKIGPSVIEKEEPKQAFDLTALVEQVQNLISKAEPVQLPDLSHIDDKFLDMKIHLNELYNKKDEINNRIDNISMSLDHLNEEINDLKSAELIIPEVKTITHIKDVSPEILEHCKSLIKSYQNDMMFKIQDLQRKNKKQNTLNVVLTIAIVLSIFLHIN